MGAALAYSAYRNAELETLSPRDLLVRLYQGMERFLDQAILAIQNHQYELGDDRCRRARNILFELQSTLNFNDGGEIAGRLDGIYRFLITEITEANVRKQPERLRALQRVIRPLREAWERIPNEFAHTTSLTGESRTNIIYMRT